MVWMSIAHAHEYWKSDRRLVDAQSSVEDAEIFILNERPGTAQEAACILDVIRAYRGDTRCDGLDLAALGRVHTFLSTVNCAGGALNSITNSAD